MVAHVAFSTRRAAIDDTSAESAAYRPRLSGRIIDQAVRYTFTFSFHKGIINENCADWQEGRRQPDLCGLGFNLLKICCKL